VISVRCRLRLDFEEEGVGDSAVDYVGFAYAGLEGGLAGFYLGEHARSDGSASDHFVDLVYGQAGDSGFGVVDVAADAVGVGFF